MRRTAWNSAFVVPGWAWVGYFRPLGRVGPSRTPGSVGVLPANEGAVLSRHRPMRSSARLPLGGLATSIDGGVQSP
jgi:hypothetical protein